MNDKKNYDETIVKAFDSWAETYDSEVIPKLIIRGYSYEQLAQKIIDYANLSKDMDVLELGTGTGLLGEQVYKHCGANISGVDISKKMLQHAAERNFYSRLDNCNASQLPHENCKFNALYTAFMFHSLYDQISCLNEMKRVLKNDGVIILIDLFPCNKEIWQDSKEHSNKYEYGASSNYLTTEQFECLTKECGLTIVKKEQLGNKVDYMHYCYVLAGDKK